MPERLRRRRSAQRRTTRWIVASVVLCSAMSCVAPVLYASDCSRWIAEYKQGILQQRAARRLRAAKYRLTHFVRPAPPVHHVPRRRPMGPLEALRRFQIDCGDLETPAMLPKLPPPPILAIPIPVDFPQTPPPDLPPTPLTDVAEAVPPLADVPVTATPLENVPLPSPVPEPASSLLVLSGVLLGWAVLKRAAYHRQVR